MITKKDLTEYSSLCNTFDSLHERFLKRKLELRRLLEETAARRREALLTLAKANRLTKHLTGNQRHVAGLSYQLSDLKARINNDTYPALSKTCVENAEPPDIVRTQTFQEGHGSNSELKQMVLALIKLIDRVKNQMLQLDLLELRCKEIIVSINKALAAFRHEERIIRRKIYPLGVFSFIRRSMRNLLGSSYFSCRDMTEVTALGNITGLILKIADSPLI